MVTLLEIKRDGSHFTARCGSHTSAKRLARSVVACDSNSARTLGQVFPSQQVMLNEQRQQGAQPSGAAMPRNSDTHKRIAVPQALCVLREHTRPRPKAAKYAFLIPGPGMLVNVRNAPRVVIPPPSEMTPVSACVPLCAIFLRKASVYPLSPVKASVGHLCEKLKNAMKSGLKQRCDGNFLAIFVGTLLDEKSNFTGGFFEW